MNVVKHVSDRAGRLPGDVFSSNSNILNMENLEAKAVHHRGQIADECIDEIASDFVDKLSKLERSSQNQAIEKVVKMICTNRDQQISAAERELIEIKDARNRLDFSLSNFNSHHR